MSTLITVIGLGLAVVSDAIAITLGALLVWTARRVETNQKIRAELNTLATTVRNLDEIFESYRKRDANRASQESRRTKRETEEPDPLVNPIPDDIQRLFSWKVKNGRGN